MAETPKQPAATTPLVTNPRTGQAGRPSTYNSSSYAMKTAMYPADLFSAKNTYGENYVVFYINVPESSRLFSGVNGLNAIARDTVEVGSAIAQTISELKKSSIGKPVSSTSESSLGLGLRQNRRIDTSITLYTPNQLTARYSVNWDVEDLVLSSAAADVANALANGNSSQSAGIDKLKSAIAVGANIGMSKLPGGAGVSAVTGLAANPKKEQLFKNVDFRTFNFEYQFAPRSKAEYENVKKIIKMFKLHMHPEYKDDAGFLFIYPSEFEIVYYHGNTENLELPRHTTSVLVDMSVNYTPQGMYNTFDDGEPTLITLNLTFKELAILTKAEIEDGF